MKINATEISYTRCTPKDVGTIIDYRIRFLTEEQGSPAAADEELRLRKGLQSYFSEELGRHCIVYIAYYQNKVVGIGGLLLREQPGSLSFPNGKIGYVFNIYTLPEYRKNGICSGILERFIQEGKSLNLDRLDLFASKAGEPVYARLGFTRHDDAAMMLRL